MRFDRLLTLYLIKPLINKIRVKGKLQIPILMYHSVSEEKENGVGWYYKINTSPKVFAEHMRYLYEKGYNIINLTKVAECLGTEDVNREKLAILTFDDGYRDFYTQAYPILKQYDFPATLFLPTAFINDRRLTIKKKEYLCWDEIRDLRKRNISLGSHSVTHPQLTLLNKEKIEYEIKRSKEDIENNTGDFVESFSYPFAFPERNINFIETLKTLLFKAGYLNGVSTRIGTFHSLNDILFLKRIPINSGDSIPFFEAKVCGAYDWVKMPQYVCKLLKSKRQYIRNASTPAF